MFAIPSLENPGVGQAHVHDVPRIANPLDPNYGKSDTVGPHPHMQFFLYRCRPGDRSPVLIGSSDIKHGFKTADGDVPPSQKGNHLPGPGRSDPYSQFENRRQIFDSPTRDDLIDRLTGTIASH